MLMEVLKKGKEIEVSLKKSYYNEEPKLLTVSPDLIIVDLLNTDFSFSKAINHFSSGANYLEIKNYIMSSNLKEDTKAFFCLFNDFYNYRIFNACLFRTNKLINDIKKICVLNGFKSEDIIRYLEYKYVTHDISANNEEFFYDFYMPIINHYSIDVGEFVKRMRSTDKTAYDDLLNWIKSFITKEEHYNMFKKLFKKTVRRIGDDDLLLSLSMEQLMDYLKMEADYKLNCKTFRFWHIDEFLVLSYIQLLRNGITIKKCTQCDKFFVAKNGNTKACSDECKNSAKIANKEKRMKDDYYNKATDTIRVLSHRIEGYENVKPENKVDGYDNILTNFKAIYSYYCYVCKKVKRGLKCNTNNIREDKEFLNNFDEWLNAIIIQKCDFELTKSIDDMKYYKFSKSGYTVEPSRNLWIVPDFVKSSKYKRNKKGDVVKK